MFYIIQELIKQFVYEPTLLNKNNHSPRKRTECMDYFDNFDNKTNQNQFERVNKYPQNEIIDF